MSDEQGLRLVETNELSALVQGEVVKEVARRTERPGRVVGFLSNMFAFCLIVIVIGVTCLGGRLMQETIWDGQTLIHQLQNTAITQSYTDRANQVAYMNAQMANQFKQAGAVLSKQLMWASVELENLKVEFDELNVDYNDLETYNEALIALLEENNIEVPEMEVDDSNCIFLEAD